MLKARLCGNKPERPIPFALARQIIHAVVLCATATAAISAQPRISLIERFGSNQVTLHFDTEANRTYTLQYSDVLRSNRSQVLTWSNLYTAPTLPFPNHYVVVDNRVGKLRCYRLKVSP